MNPNPRPRRPGLSSPTRGRVFHREGLRGWVLLWTALVLAACASRVPEARTGTEPEIAIPAAPRISLKPLHRSMREGMRRSFDRADEIIIGVYTGTYSDEQEGRAYYFDQYRIFNKSSWTWGPEMSALLPVLFETVKPELISSLEFQSLSALDKTGICWDDYEGPRVIFLVEGIPTLLFLQPSYDERANTSRRVLIDTYPVTKECRAKDVFDLMLRERAGL